MDKTNFYIFIIYVIILAAILLYHLMMVKGEYITEEDDNGDVIQTRINIAVKSVDIIWGLLGLPMFMKIDGTTSEDLVMNVYALSESEYVIETAYEKRDMKVLMTYSFRPSKKSKLRVRIEQGFGDVGVVETCITYKLDHHILSSIQALKLTNKHYKIVAKLLIHSGAANQNDKEEDSK